MPGPDPDRIAAEVLAALDAGSALARFTLAPEGLDLEAAHRAGLALERLRNRRGERSIGRKAGFTNPAIWPAFGVDRPLYAPVYDRTVAPVPDRFALGRLREPRIEPEIVLRLAAPPRADMDEAALAACVSHVAHGFEIVASPFPGWRFGVADAIAAAGLHGALLHGPFVEIRPADRPRWIAAFRAGRIRLLRDGAEVARGASANVLGTGPLAALAGLAATLDAHPFLPPVRAGEIVTTGTMTDAPEIRPGEVWTTELEELPLPGLRLALA